MPTVYILKCEHNCYYIGKTRGSYFIDIGNHFQGKGCEWTKLHKPVRLEILRHFCNEEDDDFYTRLYMTKYGLDKVRGGSYSQVELSEQQVYELNHYPIDQQITCFKCSLKGHKGYICPFLRSPIIDTNKDNNLSAEKNNTSLIKLIKFFTYPLRLFVHKISSRKNNIISVKYDTELY
jgi:hypothetical protein